MTLSRTAGRRVLNLARRLRRRLLPRPATPPAAPWRQPDGPAADVTVVGYLRTASGVGEVGRQTLHALRAGGLAAEGLDVALNVAGARNDDSCAAWLTQTSTAPAQIFNINADQLPQVVTHLASRLRPGAKRICIPFWELSRFPDDWIPGLAMMDEIWAPSRFIAHALQDRLGEKSVYMPVALEFNPPAPLPRASFNLPDDQFLFFFAFDFLSFVERKNPAAAIAAFRKAFPRRGQAGLVLKCANGAAAPAHYAAFQQACAGDPDIHLIDASLTREATLGLIAAMDAVISLHRSEGLGLLIGEAMLLGKPVIATDYGASQDFLSAATGYPVHCTLIPVADGEYPFARGQVWADADTGHAAALMRDLAADPRRADALVAQARAHLRTGFSTAAVGRQQAARLRLLCS